ncbi:MAG: ATP-binding cassette domain-containing protein [Candidatus Nomurabacteria bacterium]|nr:ATP-binding cassette domain-containing protein [Candidatus Nomurabacteria bacterium]
MTVKNITKSYDDAVILDCVGFSVGQRERVALIGDNGAGKTTLLRIIAGEESADLGQIQLDGAVGYVPQQLETDGAVSEFFANAEEWLALLALEQVGLSDIWEKPIQVLSGGQKTRLMLARALTLEPDFLLLDEPTNNLDEQGINWLADFIKSFSGLVLFSSHDRFFIDMVANKVLELDDGKVKTYGGNYSFYRQQKEIERQTLATEYEKYQRKKKQLERLIGREQYRAKFGVRKRKLSDGDKMSFNWHSEQTQRSASGQLKARRSQLARLEVVEKPELKRKIRYKMAGQNAGSVLSVRRICKSFGGAPVISDVSFDIHGAERVWLVGPNGSGKTTLLNIVLGKITPNTGEVRLGDGVRIASLTQELENLDQKAVVAEVFPDFVTYEVFGTLRSLGLSLPEIKRPISQLSRGQKTKVALAQLMLGNHQLIILDEPTNHLEIKTREVIERALADFQGAILFASHDRYFAQQMKPNQIVSV